MYKGHGHSAQDQDSEHEDEAADKKGGNEDGKEPNPRQGRKSGPVRAEQCASGVAKAQPH